MRQPQQSKRSFEETFPHYPFAELVRLAIALGCWLGTRTPRREPGGRLIGRVPVSRRARMEAAKIAMGRLPY